MGKNPSRDCPGAAGRRMATASIITQLTDQLMRGEIVNNPAQIQRELPYPGETYF